LAATKPFDIPKDADRLLGGSGVSREAPAPFCERPEVKLLRPTRHRLHWVLDVTFREDDSRVRDQRAARNLAVLRRMAINLVGRDGSPKASVRAKRKRAAWNDDDMLQLLAGLLLRQSAQGRRPRVGPCR
jgi:hypothetical protein